jgi:hypothetical protein
MRSFPKLTWAIAIVALFAFRLAYGLSRELFFEDETQIFLMGLRYYATGAWPYFGADVVWTKSEIPGALQALLVGIPFRVWPVPEAPYVLLNVMSMAGLAGLAWYVSARLPQLPKWLVWGWLMTLPWTIEFSTHIINPSYLLAPATAFFIGFFESVPALRVGKVPVPLAFALMGAGLACVMQLHLSWPLLLPYIAVAWILAWRRRMSSMSANLLAFTAGFLLFGALLIPTFVVYGLRGGTGGTLQNLLPLPANPWIAVTTLARLFSFASLEIWRFLATDDGKRLVLLERHLWIAPLAAVLWLAGVWQPIWMLREWFRTTSPFPEWRPLKWLVAGTVLVIYASYWFVVEPPQAHAFYVVAPVAFVFAAYCWTFVDSGRWRRIAGALLVVNVAFHIGQAWIQAPEHSLYRHREAVATAVREKQPEMFAHRRPFAVDGGPVALQDPSRPYDGGHDVRFSDAQMTATGPGRVALWTMTVHNSNDRVAYRDILYRTNYRDHQGRLIDQRADYIKDIFEPGAVVHLEVVDGFLPRQYASASIEILRVEALLPAK